MSLSTLLGSVQSILTAAGVSVASLAIVILGLRIMMKMRAQEGMREAFTGFGIIALGAAFVGAATALAGLLISIGQQING